MHVLILASVFPPEVRSSANLMYELSESLQGMGYRVTVVAAASRERDDGKRSRYDAQSVRGVRPLVLRSRAIPVHLARLPSVLRALGQIINAALFLRTAAKVKAVDVIIVYSPPLASGITGWILGKRHKAPFVLNVQDLVPRYAQELGLIRNPVIIALAKKLERFLYDRAAAITVHSKGNRDYMRQEGVDLDKIEIVPNWADTKEFDVQDRGIEFREANGLVGRFVVLYAGMLGYAQDTDVVLHAASLLRRHEMIVTIILGDGVEKPRLVREARRLGLLNLQFRPFVPRSEYPRVVAAADVCLATLKKELRCPVVPSKLVGYMAAGRPVVGALHRHSDAGDLVETSHCGTRVDPGDGEGLAAAVLEIYQNRKRREEYGSNGRRIAIERFDRHVCVASYDRLIGRLLTNRKGHGQDWVWSQQPVKG